MDAHSHAHPTIFAVAKISDTSLGTNIVIYNKYPVSYGGKHFFTQQISSTPFCYNDSVECNYYKTSKCFLVFNIFLGGEGGG